MIYQQATTQEIQKIYEIVQHTFKTIYQKYYPLEVVSVFCNLHSLYAISRAVEEGNSGSGKTTVAKELQKKFGRNTMLISQDVVRRDMLFVKDGTDTKAIPLLHELLCYGREHSDVVILEGIMYADWYKPLFEVAKLEFGESIFAYYFDIPFNETLRRHQTKLNCNDFGEEDMRVWWREKDYTEVFEECRIMENQTFETIVKVIYEKVTSFGY